jgi:hypothetical protein
MTNTADELSDMDEMLDGILLNNLGSRITEALHDGLGSRNVPSVASGVQAIVAASDPTGATAAAPKRGRHGPKGSKDKQPRKKRQRLLDLVGHMTLPAPHAPIYRPPFPLQLIVL